MEHTLFHDAKLKVERANQHIGDLNGLVKAFVESDFCGFVQEQDVDTGNYVLRFKMTKRLPEAAALVIGDVIHNLRAALDFMTWELVVLCGGVPNKFTEFPIRETRAKCKETAKNGKIEAVYTTLILDTIKPYKGGNDPLYALHCLDINDKHRLLITSTSIVSQNRSERLDRSRPCNS